MKINEVAKSQQQMKYIYAMRHKYGTKRKAPKNMRWVFDEEWTSGVKMKKLPKKVKKKNESRIMNFNSFVNESRGHDEFTMSDMEFVKDLYDEGMTDIKDIARECEGILSNRSVGTDCEDTVKDILFALKRSGEINESEHFDEHDDEHSGCGCHICNCVGGCNCGCCCSDNTEKEEKDEPWYDPEDCEDCRSSMEESDIEYTPDFTWKDGCWHCDHCNRPL